MVTNRSLGLCEVIRKEVFQHVLINPTRIYLSILKQKCFPQKIAPCYSTFKIETVNQYFFF